MNVLGFTNIMKNVIIMVDMVKDLSISYYLRLNTPAIKPLLNK